MEYMECKICFKCSYLLTVFFFVCAEEFHLSIDGGEFTDSEIIVMLGENGKKMLNSLCLYADAGDLMRSRDSAAVTVPASHQCGQDSHPRLGIIP